MIRIFQQIIVNYQANTFIGGVGFTSVTSAQDLANKTTLSVNDIKNFTIDSDGNVACYIGVEYELIDSAFRGVNGFPKTVIYYIDLKGKCVRTGVDCFQYQNKMTYAYFPNDNLVISNQSFRNCTVFSFGVFNNTNRPFIGGFNSLNDVFVAINYTQNDTELIVPIFYATNNNGNPDADLQPVIDGGGSVLYSQNTTINIPTTIIDLSSSNITATSVNLNFTTPSSVNGINRYEVWNNNAFIGFINNSGDTINDLVLGDTYNFKIATIDNYGNRSEFSNVIEVTAAEPLIHPQTQLILDRAILESFVYPNDTALESFDLYIRDLVDNGTLAKQDSYFNSAYNNLLLSDFSRINLARPSEDLMDIYGGMIYTLNGWEGNGIDGYLGTNFNPAVNGVNYTLNNAGKGVYVYKVKTLGSLGIALAVREINNAQNLYNEDLINQRINSNTNNLNLSADLSGTGLITQYRDDAINVRLYNDSVEMIRTQPSSVVNYGYEIIQNRRLSSFYSNLGSSLIFLGASLTGIENEALRTAHENYLTSIGL